MFVLDRSLSMGLHGSLDQAVQDVLAAVNNLPGNDRFQVVPYNRSAEPLRLAGSTELQVATPDVVAQLTARLADMRAEGRTDHVLALQQALRLRPDVVVWLTDADDLTDAEVRTITRFNQGRSVIHAVWVPSSARNGDNEALRTLARANRGTFRVRRMGDGVALKASGE